MRIFAISLKTAKDRRARMRSRLEALGLDFSWIDGVDLRRESEEVLATFRDLKTQRRISQIYNRGALPSGGAMGCYLAHLNAYRAMLGRGEKCAFILEDDAILSEELPAYLEQLRMAAREFDILMLEDRRPDMPSLPVGPIGVDRQIRLKKYGGLVGSSAYVINERAAARILGHGRVQMPIDTLLRRWWGTGFLEGTIVPPLADHDVEMESDIGEHFIVDSSSGRMARLLRFTRRMEDILRKRILFGRQYKRVVRAYRSAFDPGRKPAHG